MLWVQNSRFSIFFLQFLRNGSTGIPSGFIFLHIAVIFVDKIIGTSIHYSRVQVNKHCFFFLFLKDKLCDACLYWAFDIVPFVFQLWFQVKVRVFLSFVQILVFEYLLNFALFTLYLAPQWVWLLDFTNVLTLLCGWNWYLLVIPDGMMAFTFQWLICQTFHAFPIDIVKWFEEEALNVACCEMGRRDLELKLPQW